MEGSELFGVVVRTVGLLASLYGIWCLLFGILAAAGLTRTRENSETRDYLSGGTLFIVVGGALLLGAESIVAMTYSK